MSAVIPLRLAVENTAADADPFLEHVRAAYRAALEAAAKGDCAGLTQARCDYHLAVMSMCSDHLARIDVVEAAKRGKR